MKPSSKTGADDLIARVISDQAVRRKVVQASHQWFFSLFLSHYVQYEMASFQQEMFQLTEDEKLKMIVIMAFRSSGKSTIMNLSYVLWAILGVQKKRFVLIVSQTQSQAKNHFHNICTELNHNDLLKMDLGPFEVDDNSLGMSSLVLPKVGARITAASKSSSIRGIRHGYLRPDLVICDDLEDMASVATKEQRDDTYNWFVSEMLSVRDTSTKFVVLGNLLHEDSLLMRLRRDIATKSVNGVFKAYPLLDDNDRILWPGKYPSQREIDVLKSETLNRGAWDREYLLFHEVHFSLVDLRRIYEAEERGESLKEPVSYPLQRLGPYEISVPSPRFPNLLHDDTTLD